MNKNNLWGEETQKAIENYPISGLRSNISFVYTIVFIKKAAAKVNNHLKLLDKNKSDTIINSCNDILRGKYDDQFIIDPYQAGAGTSIHMNVNEVIANLTNTHPNDDVNMSQSTNDVIPTAIRITTLLKLPSLIKAIEQLEDSFSIKAEQFEKIIKSGRTHLRDALPITLGQEFSAYAKAVEKDKRRIERSAENLHEIGIGGTGVGTGITSHQNYHHLMVKELSKLTNLPLKSSGNLFETMQNAADFLDFSGSLRILAQTIIRISNDLRLLSSGPMTGFNEIELPEVQKGSSIMPGKVNPSILEMATMVSIQVIGYDQAILLSSQAGQLELNVMLPLIAHNLFEQMKLLTNAITVLNDKCIKGIKTNERMCKYWFERSVGIGAILNRTLGYDKAAQVVKYALENNSSIKQAVIEKKLLSEKEIEKLFSVEKLTNPF